MLIATPFILGSILMMLNLSNWQLITCIGIFFALSIYGIRTKDKPIFMASVLSVSFLFLISWGLSLLSFDLSYDGQGYHQEAIIQLMYEWNPFYYGPDSSPSTIWIEHYPRAHWLSAAFYASFLGIEGGKLVNLLLCFLAFFLAISFFKIYNKSLNTVWYLIAFFLAFNPINLNTFLSFTNDGQVSSLLLVLFFFILKFKAEEHQGSNFSLLIILTIYALNIKFNATLYVVVIYCGFSIFYFLNDKRAALRRNLAACIFSLLLGIMALGWNPYVKNYLDHGNCFYPVLGELQQAELAEDYIPSNISGKNNVEKLIKSTFASTDFSQAFGKEINYKIPFVFDKYEITRYAGTGVMIGGLGVWFSGLIMISVALIFYFLFQYPRYKWILFLILMIVLSVIANPLCWWFRFVPQYGFIPIICFAAFYYFENQCRRVSLVFLVLIATNSFLLGGYMIYNITESNKINIKLQSLHKQQLEDGTILKVKMGDHQSSFLEKMKGYKIPYAISEDTNCEYERFHKLIEVDYCVLSLR